MINSTLMLLSQYNKNTTLMNICTVTWMFYMFSQVNFQLTFLAIANLVVFLLITMALRKIKNKYVHGGGAIASILLYSICIDVVCFYVYPEFVSNQSLGGYIWSGILFNSQYVFLNALLVTVFMFLEKIKLRIQGNIFLSRSSA
ncbi:MAG: hypothetical protein LBT70_04990 [Holosporaceae bacterium]|jgi:hypothetical protein|nr:hypothetical protein [Holosporaceae bacterium]